MLSPVDYFIYLGICVVATASPGPAVFLALRNGARYGNRKALYAIAGNVTAILTLATISAAGLGAVILASATALSVIKIVGGFYLLYLGIKAWRSNTHFRLDDSAMVAARHPSVFALFREAFLVGIGNPKAIAFYTALFPQFIDVTKSIVGQFVVLAFTFAVCSFVFLVSYAFLASQLKPWLGRERVAQWFNRVTGGLFMGFGAVLVGSART